MPWKLQNPPPDPHPTWTWYENNYPPPAYNLVKGVWGGYSADVIPTMTTGMRLSLWHSGPMANLQGGHRGEDNGREVVLDWDGPENERYLHLEVTNSYRVWVNVNPFPGNPHPVAQITLHFPGNEECHNFSDKLDLTLPSLPASWPCAQTFEETRIYSGDPGKNRVILLAQVGLDAWIDQHSAGMTSGAWAGIEQPGHPYTGRCAGEKTVRWNHEPW